MRNLITILFFSICSSSFAQEELVVPKNILSEIKIKEVNYRGKHYKYKIKYPKKFSKHKTYKVFLALSGGSQSEKEVDYCYYTYFRSSYFDKYLTIIPINYNEQSLKNYSEEEILEFYDMLIDNEKITKSGWILGGTSNGGAAAFNFLLAYSGFFEGIIVMPGMIHNRKKIPEVWKNIKIVLAYGEKDEPWKKLTNEAELHLKKMVRNIKTIEMKGQEHIIKPDYNIDNVYKLYFN